MGAAGEILPIGVVSCRNSFFSSPDKGKILGIFEDASFIKNSSSVKISPSGNVSSGFVWFFILLFNR